MWRSLPGFRDLDKRLSSNNFPRFIPTLLSPIRDNRLSKHRINTTVVRIDTSKVTLTKLGGYFQNKLLTM
jgi:hypothetical protein